MSRPLLEPLEPSDRLADEHDLAARLEQEGLASALRAHARRAAKATPSTPGVCVNCGQGCLPRAVYCDADCRQDHEARLSARARQGAGGAHAG